MAEHHTSGSLVWVQDATEGWVKGVVEKVLPDHKLQVKTASGTVLNCKPEDAPLQNPSARMGVEVRQQALPLAVLCVAACKCAEVTSTCGGQLAASAGSRLQLGLPLCSAGLDQPD